MKLKLETLSDTYKEYKKAVTTLQEVKADLNTISGNLATCWKGASSDACILAINDYLKQYYENTIISMEAIRDILKQNLSEARTSLNRCDAFADVVNLDGPSMYTDKRKGAGTLKLDKSSATSLMNMLNSISCENTDAERKKWIQVKNEISSGYCTSLKYSTLNLDDKTAELEKAFQAQEDALTDFCQSLNTYVQEVTALDSGAATSFAAYTEPGQRELTSKIYEPAVVKDQVNLDRVYYLLHTPPSALGESELNEIVEAYETALKNGDAKTVEEILKCCYEYDEQKGGTNYKLTETYYVVKEILKAKIQVKMQQEGYNLMDPYNNYNDMTKDLIDEISGYALFGGLGTYAPNISGTKNLSDKNLDPTHRINLSIKVDAYGVYSVNFGKGDKGDYKVYPWNDDHQQDLNREMIKDLQSQKKDFKEEVKNYFVDKVISKIKDELKDQLLKNAPSGTGEAIGIAQDIITLYQDTEKWNAEKSKEQNNLSVGDVYKALGIKATISYSDESGVTVEAAALDPAETRARIAYAKSLFDEQKDDIPGSKFDLSTYTKIYDKGYGENKRGWDDLTDKEKNKWRQKYKNSTEEDLKNIQGYFER